MKFLLHLVTAALPEFRAPFCGKMKAKLIHRPAAEICSSAERVQAGLRQITSTAAHLHKEIMVFFSVTCIISKDFKFC